MARALIVGCGCRGRALGERLISDGWSVRGTTRDPQRLGPIEAAGVEAVVSDPDRPGTLFDLVGDVAVVHWLLGSAQGDPALLAAIHGARLEALLRRLVDTPVRGFVYESAGSVDNRYLRQGAEIVDTAASTWRIRAAAVDAEPADLHGWLDAMLGATRRLVG